MGYWLVILNLTGNLPPTWHEGPPAVRRFSRVFWLLPHGRWVGGWARWMVWGTYFTTTTVMLRICSNWQCHGIAVYHSNIHRWAQFYEAISQKIFFSQMMPSLSFHHCDLQNIINPWFKVEPAFKMNPPKYSEVSTESQGRTLGSVTWAGVGGLFSKGIGS